MALIVSQSQGLISVQEVPGARAAILPLPVEALSEAVKSAAASFGLRQTQYHAKGGSGQYQGKKPLALTHVRAQFETSLLVRWRAYGPSQALIEWVAYVQQGNGRPTVDDGTSDAFAAWLESAVRLAISTPKPPPLPRNPLVAPGEPVPARYHGQLYDYSSLATPVELQHFQRGVLPLGRAAFGFPPHTWHGEALYMPRTARGPLEEYGVVLCAPPGSGKTHLLLSWAAAAAAAQRTVVVIDVKGNMRGELEVALQRVGASPRILEFTTDCNVSSDRINPLYGISATQPNYREQLMKVAEALMPSEEFEGRGEENVRHGIAQRILCGGLQILKLMEWTGMYEGGRPVDLVDAQILLARESSVLKWIAYLRDHEKWCRETGKPLARYSVEECIDLMAIALGRQWTRRLPDGSEIVEAFPGERPPEHTYQQYLIRIHQLLDPFRPGGYMAERVRSFGPGEEICLDTLGRDGQAPIVLITAREEDSTLATSILGLVMRRIRQVLDARRTLDPSQYGEMLLLLDETRRIPGFDPAEFVSIVRQNKVGYVLVYQALDLIRPEGYAPTLLRSIGTQIYLEGLSGTDLELFNKSRPQREHRRDWETEQSGPSGKSHGFNTSGKEVSFLSSLAAQRFPAGHFPALIAVRGGPPPFLVDLDDRDLRRLT
jgi:hypothetical protein